MVLLSNAMTNDFGYLPPSRLELLRNTIVEYQQSASAERKSRLLIGAHRLLLKIEETELRKQKCDTYAFAYSVRKGLDPDAWVKAEEEYISDPDRIGNWDHEMWGPDGTKLKCHSEEYHAGQDPMPRDFKGHFPGYSWFRRVIREGS